MRYIFSIIFFSLFLVSRHLYAQTLQVGAPVLDEYYRRMQLVGDVDSNISFTIRPLFNTNYAGYSYSFTPDSALNNRSCKPLSPFKFANGNGSFQLLPLTWQQQYNSNHPYGWNDGAMIPARGYQTMLSGGFFFKFGPLSIQFRPEYVYAANIAFIGFGDTPRSNYELQSYYVYNNVIDNPERFGSNAFKKFSWGQSSIRLSLNSISVGLSNENVWWGPGVNNALILSNNAPGFKHLTFNSTRPIKTYLGHIEFQALAGKLEESNYPPFPSGTLIYKRHDWRYFTGFNFNYHPKWISGLTLGLTRTFNAYNTDVDKLDEYIPFFFPYQKVNTNDGDPIPRDQYTSLYARWLFPQAHSEVYFEYGLNDNSHDYRDFLGSPEHSRAYIFGFRKLLTLNVYKAQNILISAEIAQLSQTVDRSVRDAATWYIHSQVLQGHTNLGQVLGAGIGPGGNLQHFDASWVSGLKKLGVTFDRYEHNVDFSDAFLPNINGGSRKWVDFSLGVVGEWNYRNLLFNAKLQHITSLNYQWILKNYNASQYYLPQNTATNFSGQLGITYRF